MALGSHVVRRGQKCWFRLRVPNDLLAIIGRHELLRSLRTSNALEARQRSLAFEVLAQTIFEAARAPMLDMSLVKELLRRFYGTALDKDDLKRAGRAPLGEGILPILQSARRFQTAQVTDALARGHLTRADEAAAGLAREAGISLEHGGQDHRLLCHYVLRVMTEIQQRVLERDHGDFGGTPRDPLLTIPARPMQVDVASIPQAAQRPRLTMREAYGRFLAERSDLGKKTRVDHEATCRLLEELIGPTRTVASLSRSDIVAFKDKLLKLPTNYTKRFKGMTAPQAIASNESRGLATLNTRTINGKYLTAARSFLAWAKDNDLHDENPASNIKAAGSKRRGTRRDRDPFTIEDLQTIFSAPLFTGCRSEHFVHEPGPVRLWDHRYWLPLLGLWTGARLNELAQLTPSDVCEIDGVPCIDINDKKGKILKTSSSVRRIPVHPELARLGFLEFAASAKAAAQAKLFPDLKPSADGYESSPFSKLFSRFLAKVGVKTSRNSFHSFRHSFSDATRQIQMPDSLRKRLMGHEDQSTTEGHYGAGYDTRTLAAALAGIRYEGLELCPLYPAAREKAA